MEPEVKSAHMRVVILYSSQSNGSNWKGEREREKHIVILKGDWKGILEIYYTIRRPLKALVKEEGQGGNQAEERNDSRGGRVLVGDGSGGSLNAGTLDDGIKNEKIVGEGVVVVGKVVSERRRSRTTPIASENVDVGSTEACLQHGIDVVGGRGISILDGGSGVSERDEKVKLEALGVVDSLIETGSQLDDSRREVIVDEEVGGGLVERGRAGGHVGNQVKLVVPELGSVGGIGTDAGVAVGNRDTVGGVVGGSDGSIHGKDDSVGKGKEVVDSRASKVVVGCEKIEDRVDGSFRGDKVDGRGDISIRVGFSRGGIVP